MQSDRGNTDSDTVTVIMMDTDVHLRCSLTDNTDTVTVIMMDTVIDTSGAV